MERVYNTPMGMTGKELANILGVSESTISIVVNNKSGISDEKRSEIIAKMKELGCEELIKPLPQTEHEKAVAFVIYERHGHIFNDSPFIALISAASEELQRLSYSMSVVHINADNAAEKLCELKTQGTEGIILDAVEMQREDLDAFKKSAIPFVVFNNSFPIEDINTVCVHNYQGISKSIDHLTRLGHKRIGYIKSQSQVSSFDERYTVYINEMARLGLERLERDTLKVSYSQLDAFQQISDIIKQRKEAWLSGDGPTAFLCDNDIVCYAAIHAFTSCGFDVPRDMSFVGFDDRPFSATSVPAITTLRIPTSKFGAEAATLLVKALQEPEGGWATVQVGVELIVRQSTAKPRH